MIMMKRTVLILASILLSIASEAQSQSFKIGKWTEIRNSIVKELNRSYADTLPVDRMERAAVDAMLSQLDPYTVYIPVEEDEDLQMMVSKSYGGIGAVIYKPDVDDYVYINEPYEGSPAARAGLQCGDRIVTIDGQSTLGLNASESSSRMKGAPHTEVRFHVIKVRTGEETDVAITRERIHLPDIQYSAILPDGKTGYILQTGFTEGVGEELRSTVAELKAKGAQRIVLDLRGNGGGLLTEAVNIVSVFVPKGSLVVSQKGIRFPEPVECRTEREPLDTGIPLAVLVDSGSASASEIVTGALQDYGRATVLGRRTYGKGLVQSIRPLPHDGKMKVTVAKYYTPSGRCVQDTKGLTPDVELAPMEYSRLTYSLVMYGVIDNYMLEYVKTHDSIPAVEDFHLSETEYEDFIKYALTKEFDYRSGAKTYFDRMREELRRDKLEDSMKESLDAMEKALNMEKEEFLRLKKDEIIPFIEEEIVCRYHYQKGAVQLRLRYDTQLREALEKLQ